MTLVSTLISKHIPTCLDLEWGRLLKKSHVDYNGTRTVFKYDEQEFYTLSELLRFMGYKAEPSERPALEVAQTLFTYAYHLEHGYTIECYSGHQTRLALATGTPLNKEIILGWNIIVENPDTIKTIIMFNKNGEVVMHWFLVKTTSGEWLVTEGDYIVRYERHIIKVWSSLNNVQFLRGSSRTKYKVRLKPSSTGGTLPFIGRFKHVQVDDDGTYILSNKRNSWVRY